jgi:hypothetical protein
VVKLATIETKGTLVTLVTKTPITALLCDRVSETIAEHGNISNLGKSGKQAATETIRRLITMVTITMITALFWDTALCQWALGSSYLEARSCINIQGCT